MGVKFVCDCGKEKMVNDISELEPLGVMGLLYCKGECSERMQLFLKERDQLHEKIIKQWQNGLEELKNKHNEDGCCRLPDDVDEPVHNDD